MDISCELNFGFEWHHSGELCVCYLYAALKHGRGKYRNLYIYGPANCKNPASGTFAWLGIEKAEVVWLNDFRWKPSLIPWCELLQVLEGDIVHFPAPKNVMSKDIVREKDTPFFATSDAPLALIKGGAIDRVKHRNDAC